MGKNLVNKVGEIGQDNLFADLFPRAFTFGIELAKLTAGSDPVTIKRGTVLCKDDSGKMVVYGATSFDEEKFSGDDSTTTFTVTAKPDSITNVKVDGVAVEVASYVKATGVVTLAEAPATGTNNVVVTYPVASTDVPCCILCDDVIVTEDADVPAAAYRSGNFNPDAVTVAEGYELTDADKDTLRKYDIIFTQMLKA